MSETHNAQAMAVAHLLALWRDPALREMPLVYMDDDGVGRIGMTVADELWLIAYNLDADAATRAATVGE